MALDEEIELRKQQVLERNIHTKIRDIASVLGIPTRSIEDQYWKTNSEGGVMVLYDKKDDDGYSSCVYKVLDGNREVFSCRCDLSAWEVQGYIPGDWEQKIDILYTKAMEIRDSRSKPLSLEEREKQKRKKWGL